MTTYRMNTPKGQIQHAFDTKGEAKALKLATELGVAMTRVRRWFRKWGGGETVTDVAKPAKAPTPTFEKNAHVRDVHKKSRTGRIIESGKEVSKVHWDNGSKDYVNNDALETYTPTAATRAGHAPPKDLAPKGTPKHMLAGTDAMPTIVRRLKPEYVGKVGRGHLEPGSTNKGAAKKTSAKAPPKKNGGKGGGGKRKAA